MKKSLFYFVVFIFAIGFANADVNEKNIEKPSTSVSCPYSKSISGETTSSECPYLSNKFKSGNECPYINQKETSNSTFKNEMKEGKLKIERKNAPAINIKSS